MAERGVTDREGVSQTNYGLFPIIAVLRIKTVVKPRFSAALAGGFAGLAGLAGLATFATTNWSNSKVAIKRSLEIRDKNGILEAEAKNMKISSITVELHCYTKQSVLQFVKDFKENEVKHRLEEEFKKIGFDEELEVTLVNAEEVFQREEELRSLTVLEEGDKGTVGEVNVAGRKDEKDPSKSMEELKKIEEDPSKSIEEKEEMLKEKESFLQEKVKMLKVKEAPLKEKGSFFQGKEEMRIEKEEMLKDKEKMFKEVKESSEGPSKLIKGAGKAPEDPSKLMEEASEGQEEKRK